MKKYLIIFLFILSIIGCQNGIAPKKSNKIQPIPISVLSHQTPPKTNSIATTNVVIAPIIKPAQSPKGQEVFRTQATAPIKTPQITNAPSLKKVEAPIEKKPTIAKKSIFKNIINLFLYYLFFAGVLVIIYSKWSVRQKRLIKKETVKQSQKNP